jgi:hypothetical protein
MPRQRYALPLVAYQYPKLNILKKIYVHIHYKCLNKILLDVYETQSFAYVRAAM